MNLRLLYLLCAMACASVLLAEETQPIYKFSGPHWRETAWKFGDKQWIGKINWQGTFVLQREAKRYINPYIKERKDKNGKVTDKVKGYIVIGPLYDNLENMARGGEKEHVYEYRSGMLIEGELDRRGNFTPKEGSTIVNFKQFKYSPEAPRIYNLPGAFYKDKR